MADNLMKEFRLEDFKPVLVGKRIISVAYSDADEGFRLSLDDGTELDFGFSGAEGDISVVKRIGNCEILAGGEPRWRT